MSRTYATPLRLELRGSRQLGMFLALSHGAALGVLPFCGLPSLPCIALALGVLLSYLRTRRRELLRREPSSIGSLIWEEGNRWRLALCNGREIGALLRPFVFLQPWLVILHFRLDDGRAARLVLLRDMLDGESFRRLRVRLLIDMKHLAAR